MMIVEPCAGLGNKLLGLGSAYTVAQRLDRELVVLWKREMGCNVRSTDLFSLPMQVVEVSEVGLRKDPIAHLAGSRIKARYHKKATRFLECEDVERIKREEGYEGIVQAIEREPVIYMKTYGPICELSAESYSFLKPSPAIERKGAELFAQIDAHTVGVHVRRTDHTDAIANSPTELFAERMRQEIAADADAGFYVATDDEAVKRELRSLLPQARLVFFEKGVIDRNSREGLEDAFVEMLALSQCRKILGSYNSTFSLLPSYIGNIPLETVRK